MIWMRYKFDPFTFEKNLSIVDLQFYVQDLTRRIEEDNKQQGQNGNKLMKSLVAIRDILNYMTLPNN